MPASLFVRRVATIVFTAASATISLAQTTATVIGAVTDSSGAVIPGARITITNVDIALRRQAISTEAGFYEFRLLQPGNYSISAQKEASS